MKKIGRINSVMCLILLFLCILLMLGGLASVVSWVVIKFLLPVVGALFFAGNLIQLLIRRKKTPVRSTGISFILCALYIAPFLLLTNILPLAYPANSQSVQPAVTVQWPLKEKTVVGWGGDSVTKNLPHATWGSERWAYDLVMEPHNTNDSHLESYGIWNKEVVSPVYGTVVGVHDNEPDILPNQDKFTSSTGNYVYIKIEKTGTYLLLAHLKKGSITVSTGEKVAPRDSLGRVGNSGTSSEPHLHIHHQRQDPTKTLHPLFAEGLPLYFENAENIPMPEKGNVITPVSP